MIKLLSFLLFCQLNSRVNTMNQENQNIIDHKIHIEIDDLNNQINHNNQIESNHEIVETQSAQTIDQLNKSIGYNFKQKVNTSIVALNTTINTIGNGFKIFVGFVKNFFSSVNCFALKDKTDENPTVNINDIEEINKEIIQDQRQQKSLHRINQLSTAHQLDQNYKLKHQRNISVKPAQLKKSTFIESQDYKDFSDFLDIKGPFNFQDQSDDIIQSYDKSNLYRTQRKIPIENISFTENNIEKQQISLINPNLTHHNNDIIQINNDCIKEEINQDDNNFEINMSFLSENE